MTPNDIEKYSAKMTLLYHRAGVLCAVHPEADRDVLIQSWLMREKSPLEKLEFALLRGQVFKRKQNASNTD